MIRELRRGDLPLLVRLFPELQPEEMPATEASFAHWVASQPPRARFRAWVAEHAGELVGFADARFDWAVSAEGVAWLWVGVAEKARGRGLGSDLYRAAEEHVVSHAARKLETFALEGSTGERFAEARGFARTRTEVLLRLKPQEADTWLLPALEERANEQGFSLLPLRAVQHKLRELHALYAAAAVDVPADDPADDVRYEDWERQDLGDPMLSWDGSYVVLERERPVALAFLYVNPEAGLAANEMTGTLPTYRGRGLARLAKLATIRWAGEQGIREIATDNDATNAAMLRLNESLGYRVHSLRSLMARTPAGH